MNNNRIASFDILNILACISVVFLHQSNLVHTYESSPQWFTALGIECLCYFAVPVFYMLSGATLLRYDERYDLKDFMTKRYKRTLVPFILWSLFWLVIRLVDGSVNVIDLTVISVINGIINTKYQPIYWFFIPLFMIYLLIPLFNLAKDNQKVLKMIIIALFMTFSCYKLFCQITSSTANQFINSSILGPMIYILLGYYLSQFGLSLKIFRILIFLAIVSIIVRYVLTACLSISHGHTVRMLFSYYLPTAIFPSAAVFYSLSRKKIVLNNRLNKYLVSIATCSFGIYLLHKFVMAIELRCLAHFGITENSYIWLLICPFITYLICLTIVFYIKKIKIIGNLIFP